MINLNVSSLPKLKVSELKILLKTNNLKISGKKSILQERLLKYLKKTEILVEKQKESLTFNDIEKLLNIIKNYNFDYSISPFFSDNILNIIDNTYKNLKLTKYPLIGSNKRIFKTKLLKKDKIYKLLNIYSFYKLLQQYNKNIKFVKYIQKIYKNYKCRQINLLRGPAYLKRNLCKNQEDFLTYKKIKNIHPDLFYSYKDSYDNFIYGFNISSLLEYIKMNDSILNPYNNRLFPKKNIETFKILCSQLTTQHIKIELNKKLIKDDYLIMKDKAFNVFQKIDMLNNYTDVNWFLNLNIYQLKKLYQYAEDIWNFRAVDLTTEVRKKHIPNNNAFLLKPWQICKITNKLQIQHIILDEFNKFITEGDTLEERKTGAMWMLTALIEVCPPAAEAMPWLIQ